MVRIVCCRPWAVNAEGMMQRDWSLAPSHMKLILLLLVLFLVPCADSLSSIYSCMYLVEVNSSVYCPTMHAVRVSVCVCVCCIAPSILCHVLWSLHR
uniref:Uncharacterized protein n=1 Tax=Physcomitrium patens TaxID=3218 RepID=A0A2K1KXK9_PHYPA|nr:hypothetical protein PHYPA_005513 [Physcomitrium patens]